MPDDNRIVTLDRMPALPVDALSDEQRRVLSEFAAQRGYEARGPFIPLLRSPSLFARTRAMGDYLRFQSPLTPAVRELAILMTARRWSQAYEWQAHYRIAIEQGFRRSVADDIAEDRPPSDMLPEQETAYALCREVLHQGWVADDTFAAARSCFGESGLIDLVGLVGYYTYLAMILNVARTAVPANGAASPGDSAL